MRTGRCTLAVVVHIVAALAYAATPASAPRTPNPAPAATDDDGPVRFSLPTESERQAWLRPGMRFSLGFGYGRFVGLDGAPGGHLIGPTMRIGVRLDASWSLLGSLQYLYAPPAGGLSGLRFAGTIEPTWHVTERLSLSVGIGFGGIVEGRASRASYYDSPPPALDTSYTSEDAGVPLSRCSGVGVVGLLRGEYLFVLGPRASTGPALELYGQWTGCEADTGRVEPDTAEPIVRRQWWPHAGVSGTWVVTWR